MEAMLRCPFAPLWTGVEGPAPTFTEIFACTIATDGQPVSNDHCATAKLLLDTRAGARLITRPHVTNKNNVWPNAIQSGCGYKRYAAETSSDVSKVAVEYCN